VQTEPLPGQPDPAFYIDRLQDEDAFCREAAAWSLGEIGNPRAVRPLAGLILRELKSIDDFGAPRNEEVVRAAADSIRRLGTTEGLYALIKALCALGRARYVEESTVVEIAEALGEVGGPNAVREATDRLVRETAGRPQAPALAVVSQVLLSRLSLCGDAAIATLRRLARGGPEPIRPIAEHVCETL